MWRSSSKADCCLERQFGPRRLHGHSAVSISGAQHARYTRIHLLLGQKFAACNLVHRRLNLGIEPLIFREQTIDGLYRKFLRAAACPRGETDESGSLTLGKLKVHSARLGGRLACQGRLPFRFSGRF